MVMMTNKKFCIFILTHGRPDNVKTVATLKRCGYTGDWFIVIDNEDKTADEYYRRYGDKVLMFDKLKKSKEFDTADTFDNRKAIVYARNAAFDFARELGYDYFLELDDDYTAFMFRFIKDGKMSSKQIDNMDLICDLFVNFLEQTGCKTVAMCQGGDFIGGKDNPRFRKGLLRKAMNSFFCKTDNPFTFVGRVNEDVNTYTWLGMRGDLFFSYVKVMLTQMTTQANKGGMTDLYLDSGTYVKTFYSVMYCPSAVKVALMGDKHLRIHHHINWKYCVPKILNERWKK